MAIDLYQKPKKDLKRGKFYVLNGDKKLYFGDTSFNTQGDSFERKKRYYARHYRITDIT